MNITSSNIDIKTHSGLDELTVNFVIKGYLSHYSAGLSIKALKDILKQNPNKKINVVFDFKHMINYESSVRNLWVKTLQSLANQLSKVIIISNNLFHRLYTRIYLRSVFPSLVVCKSIDQISSPVTQFAIA